MADDEPPPCNADLAAQLFALSARLHTALLTRGGEQLAKDTISEIVSTATAIEESLAR